LKFLKHRGFFDFPMSSNGNLWDPAVLVAHVIIVTLSLDTLKPRAACSWQKASDFLGSAFQFKPLLSAL
jgi:hypothetical protein